MNSSKNQSFKLDWQHVALGAVAVGGAALCLAVPDLAKYAGPALSALVPLALAKKSPIDGHGAGTAQVKRGETLVINIGETPAEVSLTEEGDLKIRWPEG